MQQGQGNHTLSSLNGSPLGVFEGDPGPSPRELECLEIIRKGGASKGEEEENSEKAAPRKSREECVEEAGVHVRGC